MKLKLIDRHPEASDVITFIFQPEQPLNWQAGQYLHYTLPHPDPDDRGIERWFTIAAASHEGHVQITTRFNSQRSSSFKAALKELKVGDEIEADGPEGDFTVEDPNRHYVFIAGGIGITPFRAILSDLDHHGADIDVTLLYGNSSHEVTFAAELDALAAKHPKFKIETIFMPQQIDEATIKALPDYAAQTYYISGPEPMVKAIATMLEGLGVPKAQLKLDDFPGYDWPTSSGSNHV